MTPYLADTDVTLYHGDCLDVLRKLPDASVHMCATSPPFYGLRDYGTEGQIGLEETPDQWVDRLVAVFREVRRVLRDDGTLWVEIGDSYAGSGAVPGDGWEGHGGVVGSRASFAKGAGKGIGQKRHHPAGGCKPKDLFGQPWLLAKALRDPYYAGTIKNENDRVWLAAIIDGEGSICIHKRPAGQSAYSTFEKADGTTSEYARTKDSFQPKLEITNTSRRLMDRVVAIAGGNCDTKQEAGTHGRKQTIYRWTVTADKCRDLLREVYPHLVGKQHEARLAIGCPSSGEKATAAHEALKLLHGGSTTGIDFPAPGSMWEAGWYLRSEIIWSRLRPNPMPESVTDRPTKSHSTVFLLSKQPRYFYDADAIREDIKPTSGLRQAPSKHESNRDGNGYVQRDVTFENVAGANARSVWTIPTEPTPFAHFATWPRKLVARMIQAGTSERGCCPECGAPWVRDVEPTGEYADQLKSGAGKYASGGLSGGAGSKGTTRPESYKVVTATFRTLGWSPSCECASADTDVLGAGSGVSSPVPCTVLDPFAGSGTTNLVARNHGRRSIGIELNAEYLKIAAERLSQLSLLA